MLGEVKNIFIYIYIYTVFGPLLDVTNNLFRTFLVGWCCGQKYPGGLKATDLYGSDSDSKQLDSIFPMRVVHVINF